MGPFAYAAVTADGVVKASGGVLHAVLLTGGSDAATIILYDNASAASGTVLATLKAATAASAQWTPPGGYVFTNGIYADVTGTAMAAYVVYR